MSLKNSTASILRSVLKDRKKCYLGFTLVELMILISIIGILSAISIPYYTSYIEKARIIRAIAEIRIMEKEILGYKFDHDVLPNTLNDIGRLTLMDPWGNPYQYLNIADMLEGEGEKKGKGKGGGGKIVKGARRDRWEKPLNSDYDLYSMGKDGESKDTLRAKVSRDDIIRAYDGGYVGIATEH